jgi:hypothetical protein
MRNDHVYAPPEASIPPPRAPAGGATGRVVVGCILGFAVLECVRRVFHPWLVPLGPYAWYGTWLGFLVARVGLLLWLARAITATRALAVGAAVLAIMPDVLGFLSPYVIRALIMARWEGSFDTLVYDAEYAWYQHVRGAIAYALFAASSVLSALALRAAAPPLGGRVFGALPYAVGAARACVVGLNLLPFFGVPSSALARVVLDLVAEGFFFAIAAQLLITSRSRG